MMKRIWLRRIAIGFAGAAGLLVLAAGAYGAYLATFLALPKSDDHPPLRLYSAPFLLAPGLSLAEVRLLDRLHRLGYRRVETDVRAPGDYSLTETALTLYLHPQPEDHRAATVIALTLDQGRITEMTSPTEGPAPFLTYLEPELLSGLRGESRQVREWVPLSRIPPAVVEAILAVEDRRFYSHPGVDPIAIGRAVWKNLTTGGVAQGGSTITQQLAKNLFYSPQRTMVRKFKEALAALVLETKYTKAEILESYLNEIYLGQAGFVSIYGISEAAHRLFGKSLPDLQVDEIALIAGLIKGPNTYVPSKHPELAKQRRDVVLSRLRDVGLVREDAWALAVKQPLRVASTEEALSDAPYFLDAVLRQVEESGGSPLPEGLRIDTTLDPMVQQAANDALEKGLAVLEAARPQLKQADATLQGAAVVLDPKSGFILAMVGGRDYRRSQFNRAVQAHRQPGSLFKPFVYLAALEAARDGRAGAVTPASLLTDEPITFESAKGFWTPQNYDKQFRGPVSVREALEMSLNVPAVKVAQGVGAKPIAELLHRAGITSPVPNDLSLALGSAAVSLLDITTAFGTVANGGVAVRPTMVRKTIDRQGDSAWTVLPNRAQAVSPQGARVLTALLEGVVARGTAVKARSLGLPGVLAGKTGTTDGYRDAWFVGYSPDVVIGVWVGYDDERALGLTGAQAALPIWMEIARRVIPTNTEPFAVPTGVVTQEIDPKTGQLATSQCPERITEWFIEGTQPTVYCEVHGGGFWEQLKRSFGFS